MQVCNVVAQWKQQFGCYFGVCKLGRSGAHNLGTGSCV